MKHTRGLSSGRKTSKSSARTSPKRASAKAEAKFTELGFRVERLQNGDVQVTLSEWLAKKCLPLAISNHAHTFRIEGMPFVGAALENLSRDLRSDGVTIDG